MELSRVVNITKPRTPKKVYGVLLFFINVVVIRCAHNP